MKNKEIIKDTKSDNLDDKTTLALQRTILANSRTFSAWIRTGLSSSLAGLAIVKFLGDNEDYEFFASIIGIMFLIIGGVIYIYNFFNKCGSYCHVYIFSNIINFL